MLFKRRYSEWKIWCKDIQEQRIAGVDTGDDGCHVIKYFAYEQAIKERDELKEVGRKTAARLGAALKEHNDSKEEIFLIARGLEKAEHSLQEARTEVSRMKQCIAQAALGAHFKDPNHIAHAVQQSLDEDLNKLAMGLRNENAELRAEVGRLKDECAQTKLWQLKCDDINEQNKALLAEAEQALALGERFAAKPSPRSKRIEVGSDSLVQPDMG